MKRICQHCGNSYEHHRHKSAATRCESCREIHCILAGRCSSAVTTAEYNDRLQDPKTMRCIDCGNSANVYDHRDYLKPLSVDPVCNTCNIRRAGARWTIKRLLKSPVYKTNLRLRSFVNDVLSERREAGEKILTPLGLSRVVTYKRKP